jgi:hypothetical protein
MCSTSTDLNLIFSQKDLRLEIFARFLSEEWDFPTFLDFLTALSAAVMPARIPAIEWPTKDVDKVGPTGEPQYAYLDTCKAISIADAILGQRVVEARKKFNEFIKNASVQVNVTRQSLCPDLSDLGTLFAYYTTFLYKNYASGLQIKDTVPSKMGQPCNFLCKLLLLSSSTQFLEGSAVSIRD